MGLLMDWVRLPMTRATDLSFLSFWTGIGILSGAVFAALLAMFERGRTLDRLSAHRVSAWGVLGGATVPVLSSFVVLALTNVELSGEAPPVFLAMAALGGACARATLWLVRRRGADQAGTTPTA